MSYANPETTKRTQAILEAANKRPAKEQIAAMIARGIIDERGRVLYGGKPATNGAKPARKSNGASAKKKTPATKKPTSGKSSNGEHS